MRPDVRAVEKDHDQGRVRVPVFRLLEECLPDTGPCPADEQPGGSPPGTRSEGMARHFAPFWWRRKIADMVRRRLRGGVLPLGRTASIKGSQTRHASSEITDRIRLIVKNHSEIECFQDPTGPNTVSTV